MSNREAASGPYRTTEYSGSAEVVDASGKLVCQASAESARMIRDALNAASSAASERPLELEYRMYTPAEVRALILADRAASAPALTTISWDEHGTRTVNGVPDTSAPQAVRMPLKEEQIIDATEHIDMDVPGCFIRIARAIEKAHGIEPLSPQDTPKEGT
jgi:hypothetical protein